MTDSEYLELAEATLNAVEQAVDDSGADIECERSGNVLTLEFESRTKIIVNLQAAMHEIWVAAKAGGYHYKYRNEQWLDTRDESELFATLSKLASAQAGETVALSAP